ncbi:cbb3-type cytochrome c oxidase subunit 3 [Marinigracilibium pacificum]|uniref:Cbb3-type cytochrome c oxidase subunit 3 n=1 Tax=Marinigracilibium pacificum TaxID=2729599 RepID=A0A848J4L8_9BACT|nr:cbb3-type cytochrome c oxidase subunit 3 [Marinigracilibium pacificum]NMM50238.1 cbb3-type cytochrome c oxidase subunit 3 [Marinigracilibium pacificum]
MFKHYFEQIDNVAVWPIISLIIFVVFFVGLTIYVMTQDKAEIEEIASIPLNDNVSPQAESKS